MMLPTSHNNRAFPPTKGELRLSNYVDPLQGVCQKANFKDPAYLGEFRLRA